jgi:hypothetical protein
VLSPRPSSTSSTVEPIVFPDSIAACALATYVLTCRATAEPRVGEIVVGKHSQSVNSFYGADYVKA